MIDLDELKSNVRSDDFDIRARAVAVLSTVQSDPAFEILIEVAKNPREESEIRLAALSALSNAGNAGWIIDQMLSFLHDNRTNHEEYAIYPYVIDVIGKTKITAVLDLLLSLLGHEEVDVCKAAAAALVQIGESAVPALLDMLSADDLSKQIKRYLVDVLQRIGDHRMYPALEAILEDAQEDAYVKWKAAQALGQSGEDHALDLLVGAYRDPSQDELVRRGAIIGLGRTRRAEAIHILITALETESRGIRWDAAKALANFTNPTVVIALQKALDDPDDQVVACAAEALGVVGNRSVVPALERVLQRVHNIELPSRDAIRYAIQRIRDRS